MTLQIQAGKYYEANDGFIEGPMERIEGSNCFPWRGKRDTYTDEGAIWSSTTVPRALFREVPAPQTHSSLIFGASMVGCEPVPKPEYSQDKDES